ncbi:hypothetical protein CVT24_006043 [Panaeolus cyanescens]|uniref:Uncharacterized protein n=1 Tax=Panaeolus cyanescens TaxID=181874 RepID=A0A409X900_9AGAR|nr:hypothetical protein CVT24_006043 [Panaeolus cyanescens]
MSGQGAAAAEAIGGNAPNNTRSKFPSPREKTSPCFDKEDVEGLSRFLREMEELFTDYNIKEDRDKMDKLVRFTDNDTEDQWRGIPSFKDNNWKRFKQDIINSYPKARAAEGGSLRKLVEVSRKYYSLTPRDSDEVHELIRAFRAEVKKLEDRAAVGNGITSQRELVEMLLGVLDTKFAERIKDSIDNEVQMAHQVQVALARQNQTAPPVQKYHCAEERYTISEVLKHCASLSDRTPVAGVTETRKVKFEDESCSYGSSEVPVKKETIEELKAYLGRVEGRQRESEARQAELYEKLVQETMKQVKR